MAVTGVILWVFLIGHMLGSLKMFLGAESFNGYATWLRTAGEPALPHRFMLTITEIILSVSVVLHIWSAVSLARRASKARPVKYAVRRKAQASGYATHTMRYGGVIVALFVIWHLLDLTIGAVNPKGHDSTPYARVIADFQPSRWYITAFYLLALVMVGLHLRHGLWSALQTMGVGGHYRLLKAGATAISFVLIAGFVAVPIGVMIGVVK